MYYFSNILHSKHRIAGLDKDDMIIAMIVYALAAYVSVKTLIVMAPLFILYYKTKQLRPRGFLRHALYGVNLDSIKGYPKPTVNKFYQ
ncbi:hypothetical protein [uncultured Gammaproteobacteria bacterium]|jgi:hypothetical protein|uniref:Type IV conjugative transfer system protein TraL n=3 Tax=sulfur-oxidizing symbionts TaxID=32036 RepID=A0A1H6J213_9GAMM|nr:MULTISPECIES: type IV conjugative transfer system protein TraL [sulfur-oxidizing symbionts]CAC5825530.1 hypothetical protein [uncultured Gammaproteobacteria bacterium]CAB5500105.1 hypothetical protein AZO1586R_1044 [Bathymodiolus azoricus thioautotrophic gill symbiont]CAB5507954.1 hypothetical protein AZO1586I_2229 [Bathymodiolus thermophilus thioautotrophic gill symbiont]CAC9431649.1 hypothetical protein [uncultured Gammaproteobacteria bacterium]CAC9497425.1 hypothetical protein [unculture